MKRVTRKGRHVRFGQIPLNCPFSGRRSHQGSHPQLLGFSLCVGLHRAPLCRPEKGHRDLTSLSIVAVRAGWWLLKLISLHPELRVGMRRQLRKRQVTIGLADPPLQKPLPRASPVQGEVAARRADGRVVRNIPRQVQSLSPFGAAPFAQGSLWLAIPNENTHPKASSPSGGGSCQA